MEIKMKIAALSLALMIFGCATDSDPRLGMRFYEPYPGALGGGRHMGLDIDVRIGTPVRSPADGEVSMATSYNINGIHTNVLEIKHEIDGVRWRSRYIHIDYTRKLTRGDVVKRGEIVAHTSWNGPAGPHTTRTTPYPHLHFEIIREGIWTDPESLKMSCGDQGWLWPVGCKSN